MTTNTELIERFFRYVKIDTQSDEEVSDQPSTARQHKLARLLYKELSAMGVLASKRKQTGSGGNGNNGGGNNATIDISGATTQTEAYEAIAKTLFAKGLINGSAEFDAEMQKAWKENNVAKLPQR